MRTSYAFAAAMVAMASTASASPFDGFYVGGQLGHNSTNVKLSEDWTPSSMKLSATGTDYGLHAGYGQVVSGALYLGAEVEGNKSNANTKINIGADTIKAEKRNSYGAAVRAGYAMDNVLPYVRLGYNKANYKTSLIGTYSGSEKDSKTGLAIGAGAEIAVTDNVGLRGEFIRTNYGKFTETDGTNTFTSKPTESVARVGMSVRF